MSRRYGRAANCVGHTPLHFGYRLTCSEFESLVKRSGGRCERCEQEMPHPKIEHDHAIGRHAVRGLTCHQCNIIVAMVERKVRDSDPLTAAYLANPFHRLIPPVMPGLRPVDPSLLDRPRPRVDAHIRRGRTNDLVNVREAAAMLGVEPEVVEVMTQRGHLIGREVGSTWVFRRVVVERAKGNQADAE